MKRRFRFFKLAVPCIGILGLIFSTWEARAQDSKPPEISFRPRKLLEENVEGPDMERNYFTAGKKRIVFGQPKGCAFTFEDSRITILLTEAGLDGEIHVTRSPFTPESSLTADALKYREAAAQDLPQEATNVEVQPPVMNPYPYNRWKSIGFTWTYAFSGRSMVRTVSYINLEFGTQIVVTTLAAKSDAEKVGKIAKQFIGSWWVMRD